MYLKSLYRSSADRGSALVEFVLVIPMLVVLFFAIAIIGRKFYEVAVLTHITRSAALVGSAHHGTDSVCHIVERFIVANLQGMGLNPRNYKLPETQVGVTGSCASQMSDMISLTNLPGTSVIRLKVQITPCNETMLVTLANGIVQRIAMSGFDNAVSAAVSVDTGVDTSCL